MIVDQRYITQNQTDYRDLSGLCAVLRVSAGFICGISETVVPTQIEVLHI